MALSSQQCVTSKKHDIEAPKGTEHQYLTISPPIPLSLYTMPYWSNPPFLIFDIRTLWHSGLSARAPECQKLKIVGYTSNGAELFKQQQFGISGVEWVDVSKFRLVQTG